MLANSDIDKALYAIRTSGAAETMADIIAASYKRPGRKKDITAEQFLLGALLSVIDKRGLIQTEIHKVLTKEMPIDRQVELGIRTHLASKEVAFSQSSINRYFRSFINALEYGVGSAPQLTDSERDARQTRLMELMNAMLAATLIPTQSTYLAIDSTGVWSWGRNPGKTGLNDLNDEIARLKSNGQVDDARNLEYYRDRMVDEARASKSTKKDTSDDELRIHCKGHDPDARSSGKTSKGGKTEWYFGYELHAACRTANPQDEYGSQPNLVVSFQVTPGGRDAIKASRRLLETLPETENVTHIVADRWYSNLTEANWYLPLTALGYKQVVDLRADDQRWTDVDGMRVTAGWCHCPATPDHLESISKPMVPTEEFHAQIRERQAYSCYPHERAGTFRRYSCPALTGQVRCPLRPESLASGLDAPLVQAPPAKATAPEICTQQTVKVNASNPNAGARLWQHEYWGTEAWLSEWKRRTAIEQVFGKRKDRYGTHMTRGFVQVPGLTAMTFAIGLVLVAGNIRDLEAWVTNGRDDGRAADHPLLQPRSEFIVMHLDDTEAKQFEEFRDGYAQFLLWKAQQAKVA